MSSSFHMVARAVVLAATLALSSHGVAQTFQQQDDADPEMRIQQLENQLRQVTGQNEQLQYRNRQLEEQIRQLKAGGPPAAAANTRPNVAAAPVVQPAPQPPGGANPQIAAPPPIAQESLASPGSPTPPVAQAGPGRRRGDAFDPN